jgi:tetratricopeptide (TPR) repeat protein
MDKGCSHEGNSLSPADAIHTRIEGRMPIRPFSWSDHLKTTAPQRAKLPGMNEARRAFANGDLATAERICSQVLASTPDDGSAWALLTETALQRGRPDAAIVCANRAVALMPRDAIALVLRAKCLFVSGDTRGALQAAEAAWKIIDNAPETLDALGAIFGLLGSHQRAKELFLRAVAARPDVSQYLFNLAATERMTGALDEAEAHCDAAIALDPHYGLAHYLRADCASRPPIATTSSKWRG